MVRRRVMVIPRLDSGLRGITHNARQPRPSQKSIDRRKFPKTSIGCDRLDSLWLLRD